MYSLRPSLLFGAFLLPLFAAPAIAEDLGIQVPAGFEISLYADDSVAHDIFSMTLDAQGRVVVAGAGYVKILHDADGDGRAESATLFSDVPASGAHGMVFDGNDLVCTGDNSVMRLRDTNGDGVADGTPEVWTTLKHSEHGANGLVRGPDGCFYLICGNDAGVSAQQITLENSPVKRPRSGAVVRFSPEGKPLDVFAHGFRNPYDFDFDATGHLLTVDSDGERDHHLPWYAPTRLFDIAQGMEHGWLLMGWARGWNRPPSFFDSVERLVEIGRGSPTGVVAYRHHAFPTHYQGGVFSACWTLGKVYYFPLKAAGATLSSKLEVFMQTTGDIGFAPCDLAVGPQGDLFVAIGGRRTRGSVFRVRAAGVKAAEPARRPSNETDSLIQILSADQPLASWSRARWVPAAQKLGKAAFAHAAQSKDLGLSERIRAIEILVELFGGPDVQTAEQIARSGESPLQARIAWALSRIPASQQTAEILARLSSAAEPNVARAAWEALAVSDQIDATFDCQPDWQAGLTHSERRVRAAAIAVARGTGQGSYQRFLAARSKTVPSLQMRLAQLWVKTPEMFGELARITFEPADFQTCLESFAAARASPALKLEAVRLLQLGLGDLRVREGQAEVYSGYVSNAASELDIAFRETPLAQLAPAFPTDNAELNRELARLFGMLGAEHERLLPAIARQWSEQSTVEDHVHYLIVASLLPGVRTSEVTTATAECLLRLQKKLDDAGQFASRNWPQRVGEAFDELCGRDPALIERFIDSPNFCRVEQTLFAARLPKNVRPRATHKLWAQTVGKGAGPTAELIGLVGRLPANEALPLLHSQWEQMGLRDSIVLALAKYPQAEDREKFVEALASPERDVVTRAAQALTALGMDCTSSEIAAALQAFKISCALPRNVEPRLSVYRLLDFWTESCSDVDDTPDPGQSYVPWFEMFSQYYPHEAAKLNARAGATAGSWKARLAGLDWSLGEAGRGKAVFERRACHRCHEVNGHLGPELKGAVSRLSRDDLFTAIVDPNLEVSPTYQTTVLATGAGQVYYGLVVYESPEGILLQTGPDTTVRVTNIEPSSVRKTNQSIMPTGLLDMLSDQDVSDLYAYLKALGAK